MILSRALGLENARVISLCGAGGKTSLMFALAREFLSCDQRVLVTTTTKIAREEAEGWASFSANTAERVTEQARRFLRAGSGQDGGAVIVYSKVAGDGNRLAGIAPELVDAIAQAGTFQRILVEADGSARKPLKAPAAHEPVVPSTTDALIMVAGLSGLGAPLTADNLFRPEIWARISGTRLGEPVTAESLAKVVAHAEGLGRGCPASARRALFLNQADTPERRAAARKVVELLASGTSGSPDRVVIGCLRPAPTVIEAVSPHPAD